MLGVAFGLAFHLEDLAEAAGDGAALQADLAVVGAVDVANQHVNGSVVAFFGHAEHFGEGGGAGQEREEAPESATADGGAADPFVALRTIDFDHRDTRSDIHEEVGVDVRVDIGKMHWVCFAVGENFAGDLGDEEVEACVHERIAISDYVSASLHGLVATDR